MGRSSVHWRPEEEADEEAWAEAKLGGSPNVNVATPALNCGGAAFMSAALRERILCEPNSVTYSLPRSERTAGPGPSWGEGGVAVPLEPPVRSGVHEIVFNVRSDPRKFVVSVMSPLNLRSRNRVSQLTPSLECSPAPFI